MRWRVWLAGLIGIVLIVGGLAYYGQHDTATNTLAVRYGITPFQDSALPVVASQQGWYQRDHLDVKLVNLGWSDVPLALASRSIDVALYNFDSYMSSSEQLQKGGAEVVFYAPLYVWNGAAIMVHGDRGLAPAGDLSKLSPAERQEHVKTAMEQLRGKRIGITQGTTFEQTVRDALKAAGMTENDVHLVSARPEDNLAAFLAGDLDAFSAGLTERVQAKRHGAVELVIGPDVSLPAIDGLVARKDFAEAHPKEMQKLVDDWFETIQYMQPDTANRSAGLRSYLQGKASVNYTPEEYSIAWTFQHFPSDRKGAISDFLDPASIYYWRKIWEANSASLIDQKKIMQPVPTSLFLGDQTLAGR